MQFTSIYFKSTENKANFEIAIPDYEPKSAKVFLNGKRLFNTEFEENGNVIKLKVTIYPNDEVIVDAMITT